MTLEDPAATAAAPDPAPEEPPRQSTPFLVLQFFIFPMAIVAVCVAVFVIFGLIASEGRSARDYLGEVRTGSANRRWQAAFELAKVLQAGKDPALSDPAFVDEMARTLADSAPDDPRVRRYLTLALGRVGDRRAVPVLLKAVEEAGPAGPRPDPETQIYAVWALGALGDPAALPRLLELTRSEDAGVRKTAVHALGAFAAEEARSALVSALADPVDDVRWNAAVALARRRDPQATPVLLEMLDRTRLEKAAQTSAPGPGMPEEQKEATLVQAAQAAAVVDSPELRATLERLRDGDPSLKVREAARAALEGNETPRQP